MVTKRQWETIHSLDRNDMHRPGKARRKWSRGKRERIMEMRIKHCEKTPGYNFKHGKNRPPKEDVLDA